MKAYLEVTSAAISCLYSGQVVLVHILDELGVVFCNIHSFSTRLIVAVVQRQNAGVMV